MKYTKSNLLLLSFILSNAIIGNDQEIKVSEKDEIKKIEEVNHFDEESDDVGQFAVSGNAVVLKMENSVTNDGKIFAGIKANGKEAKGEKKKSKLGAIHLEGQGNGITTIGYSPFSNKNEVNKNISEISTNFIKVKSELKGGNAEIHGGVESVASSNGILAYALSDYGEVLGSDGADTGTVGTDGTAGGSRPVRVTAKQKVKSTSPSSTVQNLKNESSSNLNKIGMGSLKQFHDKDFHGKNNKMKVKEINNYGEIDVDLSLTTEKGFNRENSTDLKGHKVEEHIQPQWRTTATLSSGNGIAGLSFVTTPTRQTYSENKENILEFEKITNYGDIKSKLKTISGDGATLNYSHNFSSGNGISAVAYSGNSAKQKTIAKIGEIENYGNILANLESQGGKNSARGFHEYSTTRMYGSGNGISVYSHSANGQTKQSESTISKLKNSGTISGSIKATTGSGYGDNSTKVFASGNGVSLYSEGNGTKEVSIKDVENSGIIKGHAYVKGGQDKRSTEANDTLTKYELKIENPKSDKDKKKNNSSSGGDLSGWLAPSTPKKNTETEQPKNKKPQSSGSGLLNDLDKFNPNKQEIRKRKPGETPSLGGLFPPLKSNSEKKTEKKVEDKKPEDKFKFGGNFEGKTETNKWLAPSSRSAILTRNVKAKEVNKKFDPKKDTIQTSVDVYATGNGLSIEQRSSKSNSKLEKLNNDGVISGYAEIYKGKSQGSDTYTTIKGAGAGISIDTDYDEATKRNREIKTDIKNQGIISGNYAAILSLGKIDTAYSTSSPNYKSSLNGTIENNGILAGQLIFGGYEANHNTVTKFFETKDETNNSKYKNNGLYLVLDSKGEVTEVIASTETNKKAGDKDIVNIKEKDGTYPEEKNRSNETEISKKIINGVGTNGVIKVESNKEKTIKDSIVNAFKKGISLEENSNITIEKSKINANGFGSSLAISGNDKKNIVKLADDTTINGKIDLGKGDDELHILGKTQLNDKIELGEGTNKLIFDENKNKKSTRQRRAVNEIVTFKADVDNATEIEVNKSIKIDSSAKINGVKEINIAKDKTLYFKSKDSNHNAFSDSKIKDIELKGEGDFRATNNAGDEIIGLAKDNIGFNLHRDEQKFVFLGEKSFKFKDDILKNAFQSYIKEVTSSGNDFFKGKYQDRATFVSNLARTTVDNPYTTLRTKFLENILDTTNRKEVNFKFLNKNEKEIILSTDLTRAKIDLDKTNYLGAGINVNYGLVNNVNIGAFTTFGKILMEDKELNLFNLGANLKYKNGILLDNSLVFSKTKDISAITLNSDLSYNYKIDDNLILRPNARLTLSKINQEDIKTENLTILKEKFAYNKFSVGTELEKDIKFSSSNIKVILGTGYEFVSDIPNMKGKYNAAQANNQFELKTYKNESGLYLNTNLVYTYNDEFKINVSYMFKKLKEQKIKLNLMFKF